MADSFIEGAKEYEQKLRSQTDKGSDMAKEKGDVQEAAPAKRPVRGAKPEEKKAVGPSVVKANKTRKLVAAGTAESVEIEAELNTEAKEDAAE